MDLHQMEFSWSTHRIFLTVLQMSVIVSGQSYELYTSCGNSVNVGDPCTLTCETNNAADTAITWLNGTTAIRVDRSSCTVTTPSLPDYTSACPTATSYSLTFASADYCRDGVLWSCDFDFGGKQSNATAPKFTVNVPLTVVTASRDSDFTLITCAFVANPPPSITLYSEDGTAVTSVPSSAAVESCDGWSVSLTHTITNEADKLKDYYCTATSGSNSQNATLLGKTECPEPIVCATVVMVALGCCATIFAILLIVVCTLFCCCCCCCCCPLWCKFPDRCLDDCNCLDCCTCCDDFSDDCKRCTCCDDKDADEGPCGKCHHKKHHSEKCRYKRVGCCVICLRKTSRWIYLLLLLFFFLIVAVVNLALTVTYCELCDHELYGAAIAFAALLLGLMLLLIIVMVVFCCGEAVIITIIACISCTKGDDGDKDDKGPDQPMQPVTSNSTVVSNPPAYTGRNAVKPSPELSLPVKVKEKKKRGDPQDSKMLVTFTTYTDNPPEVFQEGTKVGLSSEENKDVHAEGTVQEVHKVNPSEIIVEFISSEVTELNEGQRYGLTCKKNSSSEIRM